VIVEQSTVNDTHRRHRQQLLRDVDGVEFYHCWCGRFFDTREEADAHFWRALRALQHVRNRKRAAT
jgi:hypothetical protein